jgi:endonuclease YncB( thermonuclease family)
MPVRRPSRLRRRLRLAGSLSVLLFLLFEAATYGQRRPLADREACQLSPGGESTVLAIAGPQTLRLADGRFIRLAEVLTPSPGTGYDPSLAATAFLRSVALGRKVEVRFGGASRDRYGVYTAHVFVAGDAPFWLQEGLVGAGLAQAFPQGDNHACSRQLIAIEVKAREEKRGHWGNALFKVLSTRDARLTSSLVQTYQIVEGKVEHVTHAGGRTIIHFGENNKFGFTATLEPAAQKQLAGQDPDQWQGRTLRIRGWIERKKGPAITIAQIEQLELADAPAAAGTPRKSQ